MKNLTRRKGEFLDTNRNIPTISPNSEVHQNGRKAPASLAYSSFLQSLYKIMNLQLADILESEVFGITMSEYRRMSRVAKTKIRADMLGYSVEEFEYVRKSSYKDDRKELKSRINALKYGYIIRTVMSLRVCAQMAIVEVAKEGNRVVSTSSKCRNKYCYTCNRIKSTKLSRRFEKLLEDEFSTHDYCFYFMTLTLRHNDKIRKGDYLEELKSYQQKLFRSKMFRELCKPPLGRKKNGIIQSFENVISKRGNHIHSHNLIVCKKIDVDDLVAEERIRKWWFKKTMIVVDGAELGSDQVNFKEVGSDGQDMKGSILETFKYSTKVGDTNRVNSVEKRNLAKWLVDSKGKNFINASGLFRGFELAACKSKLDPEKEERVFNKKAQFKLTKLSGLKYRKKGQAMKLKTKKVGKLERKIIKESVVMDKPINMLSEDVTTVVEMIERLESNYFSHEDIPEHLRTYIDDLKLRTEAETLRMAKRREEIGMDENGWFTPEMYSKNLDIKGRSDSIYF